MDTDNYSTPAPASVASRAQVSMWAAPVQGIRMPFPAPQLGTVAVAIYGNCTATANAAQGATRKGATGDEVFEDPV